MIFLHQAVFDAAGQTATLAMRHALTVNHCATSLSDIRPLGSPICYMAVIHPVCLMPICQIKP